MSGYFNCNACDGKGRVYNIIDSTSGQWGECECAEMIGLLKDCAKVIESEINPIGKTPTFPTVYLSLLPRLKKIISDQEMPS